MTLIIPEKKFVPSLPRPWMWLGKLIWRLSGWRIRGELPGFDKWMAVEYPHTTNWDAYTFLVFAAAHGMRSNWMIKNDWTKGFIGSLFLRAGAIGVDRSGGQDTVQQIVDKINARDRLALVITPEGTRKHTSHIKAGFYWIAYHSKTPMTLVSADYRTKEVIIGPSYMATGDIEADMKILFEWFQPMAAGAMYPEKAGNLFMRRSAKAGINVGGDSADEGAE